MKNNTLKLKIKIEDSLNELLFNDIGIGSILSYEIARIFLFERNKKNIKFSFTETLSIITYKLGFRINLFKQPKFNFENRIMLLVSEFHPKLYKFFEPFDLMHNRNFKIFHYKKQQRYTGYYYKIRLNFSQYKDWKKRYNKSKYKLLKQLNDLASRNILSKNEVNFLYKMFIIKTQHLIYISSLLSKSKPIALITDFDRLSINSILIQLLNKYNIPTFTFIHGSTIPNLDNFVPLFAEYVFCWGEYHLEQFKSWNKKLILVGNHKFNTTLNNRSKSELFKSLKIHDQTNVITLVTNISNNDYFNHAEIFCESVDGTNWFPIIKIHQNEKINDYKLLKNKYKKLVIIKDQFDIDETILVSDFLLTQQSTVSVESIVKGVPFAIFNPLNHHDIGICDLLFKKSNTKKFTNMKDLKSFLKKVDRLNIENLIDKESQMRCFRKYICSYNGAESENLILKNLNKILDDK